MRRHRPTSFVVVRDVISYIGGWALIVFQATYVPPGQVNEWFLLLGGSLIGVPGIADILATQAARRPTGDSTARPPSEPPRSG